MMIDDLSEEDEDEDEVLPGDPPHADHLADRFANLHVLDDEGARDLQSLLGTGASLAQKPKPDRFYCAGSRRTDPETDKKKCNYKAPKRWQGPCPSCGIPYACLQRKRERTAPTQTTLGQATMDAHKSMVYIPTGIPEFDKVLGGGVVYEKLVMLGAPPGSGKTTLLLQVANGFARDGRVAYFASGEMTIHSNVDYAKRLGIFNDKVHLFCNEQGIDVDELCENVLRARARLVLIDSLQLCTVADVKADVGTPTMIDAVVNLLSSFVQKKRRTIIVISHVNKAGDYAGTEKGKHLVDALVRMDPRRVHTPEGRLIPETDGLREFYMEGKSRQGVSNIRAMVELTPDGIRPPSLAALRVLSKLHL